MYTQQQGVLSLFTTYEIWQSAMFEVLACTVLIINITLWLTSRVLYCQMSKSCTKISHCSILNIYIYIWKKGEKKLVSICMITENSRFFFPFFFFCTEGKMSRFSRFVWLVLWRVSHGRSVSGCGSGETSSLYDALLAQLRLPWLRLCAASWGRQCFQFGYIHPQAEVFVSYEVSVAWYVVCVLHRRF